MLDLQFSELCGIIQNSQFTSDFVQLKGSVKDISYLFIQALYHVFLPCIITLLLLCFFSKNKKTIIVLKRQKHQPRTSKDFKSKNKLHWFNLTGWVITCKIIFTYFLVVYESEKKINSTFIFVNKTGL